MDRLRASNDSDKAQKASHYVTKIKRIGLQTKVASSFRRGSLMGSGTPLFSSEDPQRCLRGLDPTKPFEEFLRTLAATKRTAPNIVLH